MDSHAGGWSLWRPKTIKSIFAYFWILLKIQPLNVRRKIFNINSWKLKFWIWYIVDIIKYLRTVSRFVTVETSAGSPVKDNDIWLTKEDVEVVKRPLTRPKKEFDRLLLTTNLPIWFLKFSTWIEALREGNVDNSVMVTLCFLKIKYFFWLWRVWFFR